MELSSNWWIFVILLVPFTTFYFWSRRKLYLFASQLSGPSFFSLDGSGLKFLYKKDDNLKNLSNLVNKYPSPMRMWLGPKLTIFVKNPDQLQTILQSSKITTKGFMYKYLEPFFGTGLLTSAGLQHKNDRRTFEKFFSQKTIEGNSDVFRRHAKSLVQRLRKYVDGPEFDVSDDLCQQAYEASMDLFLEYKDDDSNDYRDILKCVSSFHDVLVTRTTHFWLHSDLIYRWSSLFKEQTITRDVAYKLITKSLDERWTEVEQKLENDEKPSCEVRAPTVLEELIRILLNEPNRLSRKECVDHLVTFITTSQDTHSSIIAFTLMMLGAYPKKQNLLVQEMSEVLQKRKSLELSDVLKLKYLDMCIKETMRLYPIGPFMFRQTTEEFHLGKWKIPKDVTVAICSYNVHRDPKYWQNPNDFYPEHFLPEAVKQRHPYAFIPFSKGPRNCIGQNYAYVNMKIILSTLLLSYEVEGSKKVGDMKLKMDLTVRPIGGYMIKLRNRKL